MSNKKDFLFNAQAHPGFQELIKELKEITPMPKYNPNKDKEQEKDWIFHSGRLKENERILQLFNIKE